MYIKARSAYNGVENNDYRKDKDIGCGAWVLVKCKIPVDERVRPQTYGIYWGIPKEDSYGRQKIAIYTPTEVCLLNHEYSVISEEHLNDYREMGYFLKDYGLDQKEPLNLEILDKGRSLCEEERDCIRALMLDGLTEQQACEEYFFAHHTDRGNLGLCYLPTPELLSEIVSYFGENGIAG